NNDGIFEYNNRPATLNFWYYDNPETEKVCKAVAEDLKAVGFKVNMQKTSNWRDFLGKIVSGRADLYHFSWKGKYEDLDKYLTPMFDSGYIGSTNISSFNDKEIDSMLSRARHIPEDEYRNKIYNEVDQKIVEKAPWVFLYQPVRYVRVMPYVYGVKIHPVMQDVLKYTYFKNNDSTTLSKK
ncbi:hypothetical protein EON78_04885, partial [bacterium]